MKAASSSFLNERNESMKVEICVALMKMKSKTTTYEQYDNDILYDNDNAIVSIKQRRQQTNHDNYVIL